jgi:hypothetical protein
VLPSQNCFGWIIPLEGLHFFLFSSGLSFFFSRAWLDSIASMNKNNPDKKSNAPNIDSMIDVSNDTDDEEPNNVYKSRKSHTSSSSIQSKKRCRTIIDDDDDDKNDNVPNLHFPNSDRSVVLCTHFIIPSRYCLFAFYPLLC